MPPLKPKATMPVPPPTPPSATVQRQPHPARPRRAPAAHAQALNIIQVAIVAFPTTTLMVPVEFRSRDSGVMI